MRPNDAAVIAEIHEVIAPIRHSDLTRWSDSQYKSYCPACVDGVLLVNRDPNTFLLLDIDACQICRQQFQYTDDTINGEPVTKTAG